MKPKTILYGEDDPDDIYFFRTALKDFDPDIELVTQWQRSPVLAQGHHSRFNFSRHQYADDEWP
jgi:hypothetical protein